MAIERIEQVSGTAVPVRGTMIRSRNLACTSGELMVAVISLLRRAITAGGVFAGATMPFHE